MIEALQMLAGLGVFAWYCSALYVGGRLLRFGVQRDNPHARWIGTYLVAAMGLGSILISIPMARGALEGAAMTPVDRLLVGLGCSTTALGNLGLLLFTQQVFRRESATARWAAIGVAAVLVCGTAGYGVTTGFDWRFTSAFGLLYLAGPILANGWTATESLLYHGLMRKRVAAGFAAPLDANRFLLWGTGAAATTLMLVWTTIGLQLQQSLAPEAVVALQTLSLPLLSLLGLTCAACYLFAFFPAAWYVERFAPATSGG